MAKVNQQKLSIPTVQQRVKSFLAGRGGHGATDEEIQLGLGLHAHTQVPARIALTKKSLVERSPDARRTTSGRKASVWVAVNGRE